MGTPEPIAERVGFNLDDRQREIRDRLELLGPERRGGLGGIDYGEISGWRGEDRVSVIRVLVADDDDRFVALVTALLERDGRFEVIGVTGNGLAAVQLAGALGPDVILMDIEMPLMDGIEATRRIRRRSRGTGDRDQQLRLLRARARNPRCRRS